MRTPIPWIDRDTAAEWPPQWPDTAVVQVEFAGGLYTIGPMHKVIHRLGILGFSWECITRAHRLDNAKIERWFNEYPGGPGVTFISREKADLLAQSNRIALWREVRTKHGVYRECVWRKEKEPESSNILTVWINEYPGYFGDVHDNRNSAVWNARHDRIALHRVEITLGPDTAVWTREGGAK